MFHGGMRWISLALGVATIAAAKAESPKGPECGAGSILAYIGTYGAIQGNGPFKPSKDGPGGQTIDQTQGVYSACFDQKTGHLSMLGLAAEVTRASWIATDPGHRVIYVTGVSEKGPRAEANIYSFAAEAITGKLKPINATGSGGIDATHLDIDEPSRTLFVANHGDGKVTALPIRADGGLDPVVSTQQDEGKGPQPRQSGPEVHAVLVDPTHKYLLAADFGADRVFVYHFDAATRQLTPAQIPSVSLPPGSGPRHLAFQPKGQLLFLNNELTGDLCLYKWDAANGRLTPTQTLSPYAPGYAGAKSGAEIAFSRDGRFAYISLRGDANSIVAYKVDKHNGTLTELQRTSALGNTPWSFSIDPSGRWMLVANAGSNQVSVLKIDPSTGKLTATDSTLPVLEPDVIAFVPAK